MGTQAGSQTPRLSCCSLPVAEYLFLRALTIALLILMFAVPYAGAQERNPSTPSDQDRPVKCDSLSEKRRRQTEECKTPEEKAEDAYQALLKKRLDEEKKKHSSFLKWFHVDGVWVPTESGASSYGLIGAHLAVANLGRVYFYGPPGVMLLVNNTKGGHEFRPALTWGVSVYLTDFHVPGVRRPAQLFLNLSKAWTRGGYQNGLNMSGLSVTWKKQ
jgi:hypothetical protein